MNKQMRYSPEVRERDRLMELERDRLMELERENRELKHANEILRKASGAAKSVGQR